jgi:predicted metal-dependent phosphoesterase TrpH
MLKASFHVHIKGDQSDYIPYDGFEFLDHAKKNGFDVIAFTCHDRVVYTEKLKAHAKSLGILLIPGVEMNLGGHTLILNATPEAASLKTLDDLRDYKRKRPQIFTIAAHPFFPEKKYCFQNDLYENLDAFDAIEQSWFYSKLIDWNKKAKAVIEKNNLPYIATSDIHLLEQIDNGHILIDAEPNIESIFEALKNKKFKSVSKPQGVFKMWWIFAKMLWKGITRYFPWTPPHIIFDHANFPHSNQRKGKKRSKTNHTT